MEELDISHFLSLHREPYLRHLKYLYQKTKLKWNPVNNKFALRAKTWMSSSESQFRHVLTQENSHITAWSQNNQWQNPFCNRPSGLDHINASRHLTWLSCQLPGSCFPPLFIRYLKQQYLIPPLFLRKKNPLEKLSLFSSQLHFQVLFAFAVLVLCKSRSTLKINPWHLKNLPL